MVGHFTDNLRKKAFYLHHFRKNVFRLFVMMFIMAILVVINFTLLLAKGEPTYYATNSMGFITELTPRLERNRSPRELLAPDPVEEVLPKKLPANM